MRHYFQISIFAIMASISLCISQELTDTLTNQNDDITISSLSSDSISKQTPKPVKDKPRNYWLTILLPSTIALLTALFATFLSSHLNRKAEFKKYIFQKRIDVYHEFFNELDILLAKAFKLVLASHHKRVENGQPDQEIPWKVSEIYTPVKMKSTTVYLLLNKEDKARFTDILENLRKNIVASCVDAQTSSFKVENHIDDLKILLDKTITNVKL